MRLGISARRLSGRRLGVGRYIEYLLREWARGPLPFSQVALYSRAPIGDDILGLHPAYRSRLVASPKEALLWEQLALPAAARDDDVLFCPSYTMPLAFPGRCVIMNHGIYDHLPDSFPWWYRLRYSLLYRLSAQRAHLVLAISESARRDLIRHYGIPGAKIRVVHPAPDRRFSPIRDPAALRAVKRRYRIGDAPFVLFAGKFSRRRHVPELVQAFALLKERYRLPHRLLLVGPDYLQLGIDQAIARSGASADMLHVAFADHDDMPLLYNAADLYVLPTEHEGFSFTIMEAMACGRAVLTLDHASLHEGLAAGVYCAADASAESLCSAFHAVLTDSALRRDLERRALSLIGTFTWQRAGAETRALLAQVGGESDRHRPTAAAGSSPGSLGLPEAPGLREVPMSIRSAGRYGGC